MTILFSIDHLESYIDDERERPRDYKSHAYPCLVKYVEPWDFHFCGNYYFVDDPNNEKLIETLHAEKESAERLIKRQQEEIKNIEKWLEVIDKTKGDVKHDSFCN